MRDTPPDRGAGDPEPVEEFAERLGRILAARRHRPRTLRRSVVLRIGTGASAALACVLLLVALLWGRSLDATGDAAHAPVAMPGGEVPDRTDPGGSSADPTRHARPSGEEVGGPAESIEARPYAAEAAARGTTGH